MILFYGEDTYLKAAGFNITYTDMRDKTVGFAVCRGSCKRSLRPLSCRIYPLAPYYGGKDLKVIFDPRAKYICPLAAPDAQRFIKNAFKDAIIKAFSCLIEDKDFADMLIAYSLMLDDYAKFVDKR